ncbi:MAG: hypothetical protein HUU21_19435 [Polyangiaceae bacterium]|nr:hypothetical protein [Polyangiaceae bacterium]
MEIGWRHLLAGAAVLFLVFLLVQFRPARGRKPAREAALREAKKRVVSASTARDKADALCEAGEIAWEGALRVRAAGYFLRALRADPTWPGAVERMTASLHKRRPRWLERVLWKRLADLPWDAEHRDAVLATVSALRDLYRTRLRDRARAAFLDRFAARLGSDDR